MENSPHKSIVTVSELFTYIRCKHAKILPVVKVYNRGKGADNAKTPGAIAPGALLFSLCLFQPLQFVG